MEDEAINFMKAWLKAIASICYCYFIASKFPKGIFRFFSLLPIFYFFTILPLSVSRPIPSVILGGFFTWIANFKLLLYSFNLGPLSTNYPQNSFLMFFFLAALPIAVKDKNINSDVRSLTLESDVPDIGIKDQNIDADVRSLTPESSNSANIDQNINSDVSSLTRNTDIKNDSTKKVIPLNYGSKVIAFVILEVVYNHLQSMVIYCCLMYLFIDVVFGACDLLVKSTLGVELEPPSDEPYLSTSLQDFWGKRWNRMISSGLRQTVYNPAKSIATKLVGRKWAPLVGVMGCFIVSGLMHELVYYHMTRVRPTWEVTWFFVLHGFCVVLEMVVKRWLGQRWKLHWVLSGPLTVGFVMVTGFWLFFPQIMRNNVDKMATEDILGFGIYMKEIINIG
ncbi:putative long-chain-alcohol O-fatty-acyltransferase 5 [Silene latifolia]|uniref:putative long-chain-alcohol O-fatty-acyltransferase 5 n=1 Tax=Silene latifolia TaxID=37657 RepID=UPI003D772BB5